MNVIEIANGVDGYQVVVDYVLQNGQKRCPRGLCTLDIGPTVVVMSDVTQSLPLGIGRKLNRRIAAAEAVQLIGGFHDPQLMVDASPNFASFAEPNGYFWGAYGNRIAGQIPAIINKLTDDPSTRQAVITLWDPLLDNQPGKRDYPCTLALGFNLNGGKLDLNVVMRSQDVWLGAPYDWFQFTQLQQTIATVLGTVAGIYRHTTWSTHLYLSNIDAARQLTPPTSEEAREWQPRGIGLTGMSYIMLAARANDLMYRDPYGEMSDSERWYRCNSPYTHPA